MGKIDVGCSSPALRLLRLRLLRQMRDAMLEGVRALVPAKTFSGEHSLLLSDDSSCDTTVSCPDDEFNYELNGQCAANSRTPDRHRITSLITSSSAFRRLLTDAEVSLIEREVRMLRILHFTGDSLTKFRVKRRWIQLQRVELPLLRFYEHCRRLRLLPG
jgi:hypothetical protein